MVNKQKIDYNSEWGAHCAFLEPASIVDEYLHKDRQGNEKENEEEERVIGIVGYYISKSISTEQAPESGSFHATIN